MMTSQTYILQICKKSVTDRQTDTHTDGQTLLEDAPRIKKHEENDHSFRKAFSFLSAEKCF